MENKRGKKIICIDIGGTAIKSGIMDENMNFLRTDVMDTPRGGAGIMDAVLERISEYLSTAANPEAVCVSSAGIIDSDRGVVAEANENLIPGYTGMNISEKVRERFEIPCYVENDVNCAAMAEAYQGVGRGHSSMLMLTVGTGIGGAFLERGKLLKGHTYSACEVGYMHMDGSSFEELAATSVLVKRTAKRLSKSCLEISGKWIFVTRIGNASTSLAQTGFIPLWTAASGNPPIPSNRLPNVHIQLPLIPISSSAFSQPSAFLHSKTG